MGKKSSKTAIPYESEGKKNLEQFEERLRKRHPTGKTFKIPTIDGSIKESIKNHYDFDSIISTSKYSTIRLAKRKGNANKQFAIKSFSLGPDTPIDAMVKEVGTMVAIAHPNLVNFVETYYDSQYFHIVMDYFEGLAIPDFLSKYKMKPNKVNKVASQLLNAVSYLQSNKLRHHKLTANNVCLDKKLKVTITGFGNLETPNVNDKIHFMSPEELGNEETENSALWSIGVILHFLAYEKLPFIGKRKKEIMEKILNEDISEREDENWDFISKCLVKDPSKRISLDEALELPYIKEGKKESSLSTEALQKIANYEKEPLFKKIVFEHILKQVPQNDLLELTKIFNTIDLDNKGTISAEELKIAFNTNKIELSDTQLKKMMAAFDDNEDDEVDYKEFLLAGVKDFVKLDSKMLEEVFDFFDDRNTGFISRDDIEKVLLKGGKQVIDSDQIDKVIAEISKNEKISKKEFIGLFEN